MSLAVNVLANPTILNIRHCLNRREELNSCAGCIRRKVTVNDCIRFWAWVLLICLFLVTSGARLWLYAVLPMPWPRC